MVIIRSFPLISSGPPHYCVGGALQGPHFTQASRGQSLLPAFLVGGEICFPHVKSLTEHTLMPAWMPGAGPLTFALPFLPLPSLAFHAATGLQC